MAGFRSPLVSPPRVSQRLCGLRSPLSVFKRVGVCFFVFVYLFLNRRHVVWMVSVHAVEKKKRKSVEKYTWLIHLAAILGNFDTVKLLVKVPSTEKKKEKKKKSPCLHPCPL